MVAAAVTAVAMATVAATTRLAGFQSASRIGLERIPGIAGRSSNDFDPTTGQSVDRTRSDATHDH